MTLALLRKHSGISGIASWMRLLAMASMWVLGVGLCRLVTVRLTTAGLRASTLLGLTLMLTVAFSVATWLTALVWVAPCATSMIVTSTAMALLVTPTLVMALPSSAR